MRRCALLLLALLPALSAAVSLPPLAIRQGWTLTLAGSNEQLPGELLSRDETTGNIRFQQAGGQPKIFQKSEYSRLDKPMTAAEVVDERGKIMLADAATDWALEISRTLRWGRENGAEDAVRSLAVAAMGAYPKDLSLAEEVIPLLEGRKEHLEALVRIADNGLAVNSKWLAGYRAKAAALELQGKDQELYDLVKNQWRPKQLTDAAANRYLARLADKMGRSSEAAEAWRSLWKFHNDADAARDYAAASLRTGDVDSAAAAAEWLLKEGKHPAAAAAVGGTVALAAGRNDEAKKLLEQGQAGGAGNELERIARYNLGVLHYRQGRNEQALAHWEGLDGPEVELARAIAVGKAVASPGGLPQALRAIAVEHNICVGLAAKRYAQVQGQLKVGDQRHQFLGMVAKVLEQSGSIDSVRALSHTAGFSDEAARWQLYGHLIAGRYTDAQALADTMPEQDGYAAAVRVYLAAADKDMDRARTLFAALGKAKGAPADYVATLAAEFAAENDELRQIDFAQWAPGTVLRPGWGAQHEGTGTTVTIDGGRLVLAGKQTVAVDPVTRAACLVPAASLQRVEAVLDLAAVDSATGGLELLDESRRNGIAFGVSPQGKFVWRQHSSGSWGDWTDLGTGPKGSQAELVLLFQHSANRVLVELPGKVQQAIGVNTALTSQLLSVGVFGVADAGVSWRVEAVSMSIQLGKRGTTAGGLR